MYALRDPDDALDARAREDLGHLRARRSRAVVPYSTLTECHSLVLRNLSLREARSFLGYLSRTAIFLTPTTEDYEGAVARVLRYPDQDDISLTDAVSAEIGARLEVPVWSYDYHFDVMGVRAWRR